MKHIRQAVAFLALIGAFTLIFLIPFFAVAAAVVFVIYIARGAAAERREILSNAEKLGQADVQMALDENWVKYIDMLESRLRQANATNAVLRARHDHLVAALQGTTAPEDRKQRPH